MSYYPSSHVSSSHGGRRSGESVAHSEHRRSRSRTRHEQPPVMYASTRRSSSVGAGSHYSPGGNYTVSDTGRLRHASLDRGRSGGSHHGGSHHGGSHHGGSHHGYGGASTYYAQTPSAHGHRRSGSVSRQTPTYYTVPSTSHHTRPRASSSSSHAYVDARSRQYPTVKVMGDTSRGHRSHSVESRHSRRSEGGEHVSFGEKMRRLFGLGPSEHGHERQSRSTHYADPGRGKNYGSHSRKIEYMDSRTGREVDKRGRPIYTV